MNFDAKTVIILIKLNFLPDYQKNREESRTEFGKSVTRFALISSYHVQSCSCLLSYSKERQSWGTFSAHPEPDELSHWNNYR
jgi:hypothetical protein